MKSTFTFIMSFLMAILMVSQIAVSQEIVTTAPNLNVCPGTQNVQVPITVQNLTNVNSISLILEFNPAAVSYVSYTANPILTGEGSMMVVNCPAPYNKIKIGYLGLSSISLPNDAVLFTFTFNVNSSSSLYWDLNTLGGCQYNDFDANPIPAVFINGALNAVTPDANFSSTPQICEGNISTLTLDFTGGIPPFIFQYNDGVNPTITDTSYSYHFVVEQLLTSTTTWNLLSITDATGCTNAQVNRTTSTYVAPLASLFTVTGGGIRCVNGDALSISLDGSQSGLVYELYLDGFPSGSWQYGTGEALVFYGLTAAGSYTIVAQNDCGTRTMTGSATITVLPLPELSFAPLNPVCYLTQPFMLSGGSPAGGTYSGYGVDNNGYFHSEYYGAGDYTLTYTYTDINGCTNSVNQTLSVLGLPSVYFASIGAICGNTDSIVLVGDPLGGIFSGDGVLNGVFYPALAGNGTHTLTYTVYSLEGCSNSSSQEVSVLPLPQLTINPINNLCANASPITLNGTPAGGWFSGPGVFGEIFYPETVPTGSITITYNFTNDLGCSNSVSTQFTVMAVPQVSIQAVGPFCVNAAAVPLVGNPLGGTFNGEGVLNGQFDPGMAGPGNWPITYSFTDENGCSNYSGTNAMVYSLPDVFMDLLYPVCVNANPVTLSGWPLGGSFTGTGVEGNHFYPSVAGTGTYEIIYTYTDEQGCTNTAIQSILVYNIPTASFTLPESICQNGGPIELIPSPEGGWFEGAGIYGNWFYPGEAGIGIHSITYHYSDNNACGVDVTHNITVFSAPQITIETVNPICTDVQPIILNATPAGGIFSGTGVENGMFNPVLAGAGYWQIFYTVTSENGCTSTASIWIMVNDLPQVALYGPENICADATPALLIGYPENGQLYGAGIEGNYFNPSSVYPGTYILTYIFSNQYGCSNYATLSITVHEVPLVSIEPIGNVCVNSEPVALLASPAGGYFSGFEVSGNYFYPAWAGTGTFTIAYNYTDAYGCSNSAQTSVSVNPISSLNMGPFADVCINAPAMPLTATPPGGSFAGNGVVGNMFNPSVAGLGTSTITYTYSNEFGCTSTTEATITVNNSVQVYFEPLASICVNAGLVQLNASPAGGTFSGPGVNANTFDPLVTGVGTFTLVYNYSNEQCQGTAYQTVTVLPVNEASFQLAASICVNAGPIALMAYPVGGVFSGEGVYANEFFPSSAGVGTWLITYTFSNEGGCISSVTNAITVNAATLISINPVSPVCIYSAPILLTGNPAGGVFSGQGVVDNMFFPALGGLGITQISYTYVNENGCTSSSIDYIEVVPAPEVSIQAVGPLCSNGGAINLSAYPAGGIFSGEGVVNNTFDPALSGTGSWVVSYTYTNGFGCFASASTTITVLPDVMNYSITGGGMVCPDVSSIDLSLSGSQPDYLYTLYYNGVSTNYSLAGTGNPLVFTLIPQAGSYTIYASSSSACSAFMTGNATVAFNPALFGSAGPDVAILSGSSTVLSATAFGGTAPFTYFWFPGSSVNAQYTVTPDVTTTYSLMIMDDAGCMAVDEVTVSVLPIQNDLHGVLTYMNDPMTPMNNCTVELMQGGSMVATTLTDDNGNYSFLNLPLGNYSLHAETNKAWGGGNAVDGLLMLKHFVGEQLLTGLKHEAADVSGEGIINAHDALNTMRRFVGLLADYSPVGDWVFEHPNLTIDGFTPQFVNFQGLCMSDVNGDYLPPYAKREPSIFLNTAGTVTANKGLISLAVSSQQQLSIGAISLIFDLPVGVDVQDVSLNNNSDKLVFKQIGNELRIAWCSLIPITVKAGETLLTLSLKAENVNALTPLSLDGSSTLADGMARVIQAVEFTVPAFSEIPTDLELSNYPNPFNASTQIRYNLAEDGNVQLSVFNLLGEKLIELVNADQKAGDYELEFNRNSLSPGSYLYKMEFSTSKGLIQKSGLMTITR